jgi:hypothetical protein
VGWSVHYSRGSVWPGGSKVSGEKGAFEETYQEELGLTEEASNGLATSGHAALWATLATAKRAIEALEGKDLHIKEGRSDVRTSTRPRNKGRGHAYGSM